MTETETAPEPAPIPHRCWAVADAARRGWLGMYSAPKAGVCRVRDRDGFVVFFENEERALLAASHAMCRALDAGRPDRTAAHKVFKPTGSGRNRRASKIDRRSR